MSEHVRVERNGAVLAITLARPERRNAITVAMYEALAGAIEGAAGDDSVQAITLHGEGQDFAAGNDLADFLEARPATPAKCRCGGCCERSPMRNPADRRRPRQLRRHRHDHAAPLRPGRRRPRRAILDAVRRSRARSRGGELASVPRLAGRRRAARYLLLAEPFGAAEALDIGLVSHLAPEDELDSKLDKAGGSPARQAGRGAAQDPTAASPWVAR